MSGSFPIQFRLLLVVYCLATTASWGASGSAAGNSAWMERKTVRKVMAAALCVCVCVCVCACVRVCVRVWHEYIYSYLHVTESNFTCSQTFYNNAGVVEIFDLWPRSFIPFSEESILSKPSLVPRPYPRGEGLMKFKFSDSLPSPLFLLSLAVSSLVNRCHSRGEGSDDVQLIPGNMAKF